MNSIQSPLNLQVLPEVTSPVEDPLAAPFEVLEESNTQRRRDFATPLLQDQRASTTSKVGFSCRFTLVGLLLCICSLIALITMELGAVHMESFFAHLQKLLRQNHNGYGLVYATGTATTSETLQDELMGVNVSEALILQRHVNMFQWVESQDVDEKSEDYTYDKEWDPRWQDSSDFEESFAPTNPSEMEYSSQTYIADVTLGSYKMSQAVTSKLNTFYQAYNKPLSLLDIPDETVRNRTIIQDGVFYIYGKENDHTHDPVKDTQVGDYKVEMQVVVPQVVSVIALLGEENTLVPYPSNDFGDMFWVLPGQHTAASMLRNSLQQNKQRLLPIRIVCTVLLYLGMLVLYQPISVLGNAFPILEKAMGSNMKSAAVFFAPLAAFLSTTTIAICWLLSHPVLSMLWFMLEAIGIYLVVRYFRSIESGEKVRYDLVVSTEEEQVAMELEEV